MALSNAEEKTWDGISVAAELEQVGEDLREKIARRRQKLQGIVGADAKLGRLAALLKEEAQPSVPAASESIVDTPSPESETPASDPSEQPVKNLDSIMDELSMIEQDIDKVIPALSRMDGATKKRIVGNMARQERDWDILKPSEIRIDREEVGMWGGFLGTAKKRDFKPQKVIETLEGGEIAELVIDGFELFQIVKIRAKNKDVHAMCVVEFIPKGKKDKITCDYFITLPLIEGIPFSILRQGTMQVIATHKIEKLGINREHRSLIRKFFDLLS